MRLVHFTIILIVALAASPSALAQAVAGPRIATIRSLDLLRDAPQIKAANEKMKAEFEKKQKDLDAERKKLEDDVKKFQREADTLSAQQRANSEKDLNTRKIDFEFKARQLSEQVQTREQELRRELQTKFAKAIEELAREQGIELVLQDPVYAAPAIDITDQVLKRLAAGEPAAKKK